MSLNINGASVPDEVLEREVMRLSSGLQMDAPTAGSLHPAMLRAEALRNVVKRTLLLQAARARKLHISSQEVDAERRRRREDTTDRFCGTEITGRVSEDLLVEDLLVQRISADLTRHVPRPGRTEVEAFYKHNQHRYYLPEAVQAAHIIRNIASASEEAAVEAVLLQAEGELEKGKPFSHVADRYSDCKGVGGAVGWVVRGSMVEAFEDIVFALAPGQRSGIFRTVFGMHIAAVAKRREAGPRPFVEVRAELVKQIFTQRQQQALGQALARFEAESEIRFEGGTFA